MAMILPILALWVTATAVRASCVAPPAGEVQPPACKCGHPTVEDAFAQSRTVFSGVVVEVHDEVDGTTTDSAGNVLVGLGSRPVTLRVTRSWKGVSPGDTITVLDASFCGVGFRNGEEYLVYAPADEEGALITSPCQRTRALAPPEGGQDFRLPPASHDMAVLDSIVYPRRP